VPLSQQNPLDNNKSFGEKDTLVELMKRNHDVVIEKYEL
jgi:hypothetical protein